MLLGRADLEQQFPVRPSHKAHELVTSQGSASKAISGQGSFTQDYMRKEHVDKVPRPLGTCPEGHRRPQRKVSVSREE